MLYERLRLYIPVERVLIPKRLKNDKHLAIIIFPENNKFFDFYELLNFRKSVIKNVYVPRTKRPVVTKLDSDIRQKIREHKLIPVSGKIEEDYLHLIGRHFFLDPTSYLEKVIKKLNIKNLYKSRGLRIANRILNSIGSIPSNHFEKVVFYSVDMNKHIPRRFFYKKFAPLYLMLYKWEKGEIELPFDKIILFLYSNESKRFVLLFDKNKRMNLNRIRKIVKTIEHIDNKEIEEKEKEQEIEDKIDKSSIVKTVITKEKDKIEDSTKARTVSKKVKEKVKKVVKNYTNNQTVDIKKEAPDELVLKSYLQQLIRDKKKVNSLMPSIKKLTPEKKNIFLKNLSKKILVKDKVESESSDTLVKSSKPNILIDDQVPKHLIDLRKNEFVTNLKNDIVSLFKTLENETIPLKFKDIKIEELYPDKGELQETLLERYTINLLDEKNNNHEVIIDLPKLTENGTFIINGKPKVLVNQIVTHPIFFVKPFSARFESSYSSFSITSKQLKTKSYIMAFFASYKMPLLMLLSYKIGFDEALKMFDIKYKIVDEKTKNGYKLPNDKYIIFETHNILQEELVESFNKSVPYFPKNLDINSADFWRETLVKYNGNRNSIYIIDQTWKNIVTPIEESILLANNEPTKLPEIIKYMAEKVVTGMVYDRNDIAHSRIRSSEILVAQLQKQIKSAYNEYLSKILGGDPKANYYIDPRKVLVDIKTSQNVQNFESINPLEEISFLTRITPVGIGGIPNLDAMADIARNIHNSYFGNIDPLESPTGANIGIQQHLTVGASITNNRGMFGIKSRDKIKPTEILGSTAAMIPYVEFNEGARINMATGQAKQAFPLLKPENPAVQSGYESLLTPLLSDNFVKKSPVNGKIIEITKNFIVIKDSVTKNDIYVDITPRILQSGQGKNGLSMFKPIFEIGKQVKKGQIIAEGANIVDGLISNGVNLLVALMPWKGYNFEDGQVISKSAAEKFISLHNEEYKIYLTEDEDVLHIAKVGDKLEKGDILISYSTTIHDVETLNVKRAEGGEIVRIEVYNNLPRDKDFPKELEIAYQQTIDYYKGIYGKYPKGRFKEQGRQFKGILIKFIVKQELKITKGDKINNRFFNKGLISIIEEDENMPITPWGERVELVYNTLSIINRMNPGQLLEMHTGLISRKLCQLMETSPKNKFMSTFGNVLKILDKTEKKTYSTNIISSFKKLSDVQYKKLQQYYKKKRFIPIICPPFKGPKKEDVLKALSYLNLKPAYKLRLPEFNNRLTDDEIGVGYIYVVKLEHISEKKLHARSTGPYVAKTLAPTGGKKRSGGASLGELDLYSLLAYDTKYLIDEFYGPLSNDHKVKNNMISEIIDKGDTTFKESFEDPTRDMFVQYMSAIHLDSK